MELNFLFFFIILKIDLLIIDYDLSQYLSEN